MLGRAAISLKTESATLAIPRSAVVRDGLNNFVFMRAEDGSIQRQRVITGWEDDRFVTIVAGLRPGEEVAVTQVMGLQTAYASIR